MSTKVFMMLMLCVLATIDANAQHQVKGEVFARSSRKPIAAAEVFNLKNNEHTVCNAKGEFSIKAELNDLLVFKMAGYKPDTLLLINLKPMRRYLDLEVNMLHTVAVTGQSLREQYAQKLKQGEYMQLRQGRGLLFSPSRFFSKEGRDARRLKRLIKQEEAELPIDRRFNIKTVTAILPLKQPELDAFLVMYRPSLKFVRRADVEGFKFYLLDSYRKFKQLAPEKRILPSLKLSTDSLN